jgi:hypothetical protein
VTYSISADRRLQPETLPPLVDRWQIDAAETNRTEVKVCGKVPNHGINRFWERSGGQFEQAVYGRSYEKIRKLPPGLLPEDNCLDHA